MINIAKLVAANKRFWALGIAKGWTELRASKHPPVPHISKQTVTGKTHIRGGYRYSLDGFYISLPDKWVDKQIKLEITTFTGGKVIGVVPAAKLRGAAKLTVSMGGMVEISPEVVVKLLGDKL